MKVGKCTKKCTVLKSRVVVVFMSVGFDSFPFLLTKRETGEARARKKIEASTTFWLAFVSLSHFSRFA